jgi:gag-polypeptide of LTR copia-type
MQSYLDQKRSIADRFRLVGSPVSEDDLQLFILHGLSSDYDSLIVSLNSKSGVVSFNELVGLLLTHEQRLLKHVMASTIPSSFVSSHTDLIPMQSLPQANLASSFSNLDLPYLSDNDILSQFHVFFCFQG